MRKRDKTEIAKRYIFLVVGLFINGLGVSFITKANLGTSPITSIPYTLSLGFTPTVGMFTFIFNALLIVVQIILLKRDFELISLLQLPVVAVFSFFIDLTMAMLEFMNPQVYIMKLISLLIGCLILGFGVFTEIVADVVMLPGEAVVRAISIVFKTDFGKTKVVFDSSMTIIAAVISLVMFHTIAGVREGTVIASIIIGTSVRFYKKKFGGIERILMPKGELEQN